MAEQHRTEDRKVKKPFFALYLSKSRITGGKTMNRQTGRPTVYGEGIRFVPQEQDAGLPELYPNRLFVLCI